MTDPASPATLAVWAGEDESLVMGATQVPVVYSAAYGYPDVDSWLDVALGRQPGHIYSRNTNPTVHAFEEKVRLLEGAEAATSFATGMAAISNTLFTLLSPGDRVVSVKDTYGGTNKIFTEFLPRFQVEVALCDTNDHAQIEAAIAQGCRVLYLETPTNPTLKVMDIARLAAAGQPPARSWWPTTPSPRRSTRTRCSWARTWCCTAPPSSWAATPMRWAAWSAAIRSWSSRSTTTARSPARRSTRWPPTCCSAG